MIFPRTFSMAFREQGEGWATVAKHFTNHKTILSIEETHKTDESVCLIFILYKHEFVAARNFIANFCKMVFPCLYPSQDKQDIYRVTYQTLPHLVDSPSAGGAVGANSNHLADILNEAETAQGTPSAFGLLTWAD
jgi:hypothetical protein